MEQYSFEEFKEYKKRPMMKYKKSSSKFLGVRYEKRSKKWEAVVRKDGKKIWLGIFLKEKDAAKAVEKFLKTGEKPVKQKRLTKKEYGKKLLEQVIKMKVAVIDYMPDGQILVVSPSDYEKLVLSMQRITSNEK